MVAALRGEPIERHGRGWRRWSPAVPSRCGHCGGAQLFIDEPDGDVACLVCGWRPTRRPTPAERDAAAGGVALLREPRGHTK